MKKKNEELASEIESFTFLADLTILADILSITSLLSLNLQQEGVSAKTAWAKVEKAKEFSVPSP